MNQEMLSEVLSSSPRLRIADAVSLRPRTLGELSSITGISVQGVLRHLKMLGELGLVEERKLAEATPKARRLYASGSTNLSDYSLPGLTVVKATERVPPRGGAQIPKDLELMSGELIIHRRRIADEAKKLGRMIEELVDAQEALTAALEELPVTETQKLVLQVLLTEETKADGERVLSRYYGIEDRRSIDEALARAK
jgi:DNA-binding transcriptional ArsR family regulator